MASHGCFRMFNKDVETIYPWVKRYTVIVIGNPIGYMAGGLQRLNVGDKCSAVTMVQEKLWRKVIHRKARWDFRTVQKSRKNCKKIFITVTGQVGYQEYEVLGILQARAESA